MLNAAVLRQLRVWLHCIATEKNADCLSCAGKEAELGSLRREAIIVIICLPHSLRRCAFQIDTDSNYIERAVDSNSDGDGERRDVVAGLAFSPPPIQCLISISISSSLSSSLLFSLFTTKYTSPLPRKHRPSRKPVTIKSLWPVICFL